MFFPSLYWGDQALTLLRTEPTNHLDLEAVLWLESYLQAYRHTVIVVSHDRSFLNEVCTDTIEFKKKKLTYYKGDYDTYVRTSNENVKNQMRVYQAYKDKRDHMVRNRETCRVVQLPLAISHRSLLDPKDGVHHEVQGVGQPRQARAVQGQGRGEDGPRGAGPDRGGTALEVLHTEPRAARPAHHRHRRRLVSFRFSMKDVLSSLISAH